MTVKTRTTTTHTLDWNDHEFDLEFNPDSGDDPVVKEMPDGGYVVGYLVRDTDPGMHPFDDCDGQGKFIDGRNSKADWEERCKPEPQNKNWVRTETSRGGVWHDGLDVMWDVYSHGSDVWRLTNGGQYFPDEQWDVSSCAGVWYPDESCLEHILSTAILKGLPKEVTVKYKTIGDKLNLLVIEIFVGDALKEVMKDPAKWEAKKHEHLVLTNKGKGYKSFTTAAQAARTWLGVTHNKDDLVRWRREVAVECAEQGLKTWNQWISGDVWGVCVETFDEDGEKLTDDACWGHIGEEWAKQAMEENMSYHTKEKSDAG